MTNSIDQDLYYSRQSILPSVGSEGKEKLDAARVLVIGAGGLGCPVLQYLATSGLSRITVCDDDVVELTNLHRQTLYTPEDIGVHKADKAKGNVIGIVHGDVGNVVGDVKDDDRGVV